MVNTGGYTNDSEVARKIWPHLAVNENAGNGNDPAPSMAELQRTGPAKPTVVDDTVIVAEAGKDIRTNPQNGKPNVDFGEIVHKEGGRSTKGYVPKNEQTNIPIGQSGTTVATGVDLGQMNEGDLKRVGITEENPLFEKLKPYLGIKREEAVRLLEKSPLEVSEDEAAFLDKRVHTTLLGATAKNYDKEVDSNAGSKFHELPPAAQTVIYSVAVQHGPNLSAKAPRFWGYVTKQDWKNAYKELNDFGDKYSSRRKEDAEYLKKGLGGFIP